MVKFVLRNMWQRKARTFLTVLGIVVGIFALTVLGGLSARLNQQVKGARSWFTSNITVVPAGGSLFGASEKYLELSKVDEIEKVPGVSTATAGIGVFISDSSGFSFGAPDLIIGLDLAGASDLLSEIPLEEGRLLEPGDRGKVVLGATLAEKYDVGAGDTVELRDTPFEVVGVLGVTLSAPDTFAFAPFDDALELFKASNPYFQVKDIASTIYVRAEPGVDKEALSKRMGDAVADARVISPSEAEKQISQFSLIFNSILFGVAFIALVVGGLSIINTMVMSVSERTREIGLKKAVGAETRTILGEYLLESAMIGLMGGLIGTGLGVVSISVINRATSSNQVTVFAVTALVVVGPVIFATVLGALAGIFPALRAARLKPVESLKED